jgi:hypothetical protein
VQLHRKYAKDGLVAISVSLDEPRDKADAVKFLRGQDARFTHLLLDEEQEFWQKKFNEKAPPMVFVFNRAGKWTKFTGEKIYDKVEELVQELLHSK